MNAIEVQSPAKLNLFLHITGRLDNGYHELQSIFDIIDLHDKMRFELNHDAQISLLGAENIATLQDNLIYKAAQMLFPFRTDCSWGCKIGIEKNIPMGAGLGGGSSNATTTLMVLNRLWQCGLTQQQLLDMAVKLGADVPIFIHGQMAWVEGIGEKISPIDITKLDATENHTLSKGKQGYIILKPHCHISTQALFQHSELKRDYPRFNLQDYIDTPQQFENCFEKLVLKQYPEVQQAFDYLQQYAETQSNVKLTGTGSCVFLMLNDRHSQQDIENILAHAPCQAYHTTRILQSQVLEKITQITIK
ncbi:MULTISPECIES: 4-(cytidine 5'-diphospho)-2-C-methyl-D-erythritol kinase [unclassified Acinetobacter]|uniref:4-(cytidine 5'-diphospho)-2-C-methyl-D-erythritol kinase n=1 Tax=unclassified Acinetobacter TaxID=196816 RepID=UPI0035B7F8A0